MAADDYAKSKQRIAKLMEGASCTNDRGTCKRTTKPKGMVGPEEREGSQETSVTSHGEPRRSLGDEKGEDKDARNSPRAYDAETLISHMKTLSVADESERWIS